MVDRYHGSSRGLATPSPVMMLGSFIDVIYRCDGGAVVRQARRTGDCAQQALIGVVYECNAEAGCCNANDDDEHTVRREDMGMPIRALASPERTNDGQHSVGIPSFIIGDMDDDSVSLDLTFDDTDLVMEEQDQTRRQARAYFESLGNEAWQHSPFEGLASAPARKMISDRDGQTSKRSSTRREGSGVFSTSVEPPHSSRDVNTVETQERSRRSRSQDPARRSRSQDPVRRSRSRDPVGRSRSSSTHNNNKARKRFSRLRQVFFIKRRQSSVAQSEESITVPSYSPFKRGLGVGSGGGGVGTSPSNSNDGPSSASTSTSQRWEFLSAARRAE